MSNPYDAIIKTVQVNIPFAMLHDTYLDRFIAYRLNPEIGFDAAALDKFSLTDFKHAADVLHQHHLTITFHAPFMDLSPGSNDDKVRSLTRQRFEQVIELIPLFQPKTVVCHAGYDEKRYGYNKEEWYQNSLETWIWLSDQVHSNGSRLMVENVYEHHPDEIKELFERMGDETVGFCLDPGHVSAFSTTSLDVWLKTMKPYIRQIHLHDNDGKKDDHMGLGKGSIDFQPLMNYLSSKKDDPPIITLEPHEEKNLWDSLEFLDNNWPFQ